MSLIASLKGKGPSGFGYGSTAEEVTAGIDLSGRTVLVTGSTSGIGLETARVLALRGARVWAGGRTEAKAKEACGQFSGHIMPVGCELSDPHSVRSCVAKVQEGAPLDAIICNAGIMAIPRLIQAYGYELQFFTNHVGHFMLVTGLLGHLSEAARVVMLSSEAHKAAPREGIQFDNLSGEHGYSAWAAYGQSKLANLLFSKELARRFAGTSRTANAVHPGVIKTNLARSMNVLAQIGLALAEPLGLKSIPQGAATQCYVATHPSLAKVSGEYFSHCNVARSTRISRDAELAQRLWQETERIVARLPV